MPYQTPRCVLLSARSTHRGFAFDGLFQMLSWPYSPALIPTGQSAAASRGLSLLTVIRILEVAWSKGIRKHRPCRAERWRVMQAGFGGCNSGHAECNTLLVIVTISRSEDACTTFGYCRCRDVFGCAVALVTPSCQCCPRCSIAGGGVGRCEPLVADPRYGHCDVEGESCGC